MVFGLQMAYIQTNSNAKNASNQSRLILSLLQPETIVTMEIRPLAMMFAWKMPVVQALQRNAQMMGFRAQARSFFLLFLSHETSGILWGRLFWRHLPECH